MINSIYLFKTSSTAKHEDKSPRTSVDSKISDLFKDPAHSALLFRKDSIWTPKSMTRTGVGFGAGAFLANLGTSTGAMVALHEVVGHGFLGIELTKQSGPSPTYHVQGWENFRNIGEADSFKKGLAAFFHWLFPVGDSRVMGVTYSYPTQPNGLGEAMGPHGRDAWISLAGSLPSLFVDTISVVGGMHVRKSSPTLGALLVGFGLMDNAANMAYPLSAAMMTQSQMVKSAESGHDFANFAIQMSEITGMSAHTIAISTSVFFASFVPIIAAAAYMHTKSQSNDVIPDVLALKHWVEKAKNDPKIAKELAGYYQAYPGKDDLRAAPLDQLTASPSFHDFLGFLLDKIPQSSLDACKKEILASWEKNLPKDRIQIALTAVAGVGMVTATTSTVLKILSLAFPLLHTAAAALTYASPIFIGVSVISAGYQVYKDFQCPDSTIPRAAKMLSIAKLTATLACAVLMTAALFMPGLNLAFIGVLFVGILLNVVLNSFRSQVICNQFVLQKALSPEVWNVMYPVWKSRANANIPMNHALKTWVECVSKKVDLNNIKEAPTLPQLRPHDFQQSRFEIPRSENVGHVLTPCPSI